MSVKTDRLEIMDGLPRIRDLLESPGLNLGLVAGSAGLDRLVSWAHVCELPDPGPWLQGGELVLTSGLAVPRDAAGQRSYVHKLIAAGAAGLGVSDGLHAPTSMGGLYEAADAAALPVLAVPLAVPFVMISQEVAAGAVPGLRARMSAQVRVFGTLRQLASSTMEPTQLFAQLESISGYRLYVCGRSGLPLLPGVAVPPPSLTHLLPSRLDAAPAVPGGFVLPLTSPGAPGGWLLALERPDAIPAGLAAVQGVAVVALLQVSLRRQLQATVRRQGAEVLAELLGTNVPVGWAAARLASAGFTHDDQLRLWALDGPPDVVDQVGTLLADDAIPHLILRQNQAVLMLLSASSQPEVPPGVHAGLSTPVSAAEQLHVTRREALWALSLAVQRNRRVVEFDGQPAARWLMQDPQVLQQLVRQVLGAALHYDATHGADLVPTVRVFLENNRQVTSVAEQLGLHVNGVRYRLRRFEQLTSRDLSDTSDVTDVWLALAARQTAAAND